MGLLDDAIREHLDLKRQHGADESELRRKEDEALGPARREAPATEGESVELEPEAHEETLPPVDDPAEAPADEGLVEEDFAEDEPPRPAQPGAVALGRLEEESEHGEAPPAPDEDVLEPDLGGPVEQREPLEEGPLPEEGEDVLEETPEFLQETPEHDRLWFEQKPPRDFEFDDE